MNKHEMREKYSELRRLFGCYFNSEWNETYSTKEEVIFDFAKHRDNNTLLDTLIEIEELKKQFPEDERLKEAIEDALGLGYGLGIYLIGMTAFQWLDLVESIIKRELNNKQKKT